MDADFAPVRALLGTLHSRSLRSEVFRLLCGARIEPGHDVGANLVRAGLATPVDQGLSLAPDFWEKARHALHPDTLRAQMLTQPRFAVPDVPARQLDPLVQAVARRILAPGERISEQALNERLCVLVEDVAFFRRRACDLGVLERRQDGSLYWLSEAGAVTGAELPAPKLPGGAQR